MKRFACALLCAPVASDVTDMSHLCPAFYDFVMAGILVCDSRRLELLGAVSCWKQRALTIAERTLYHCQDFSSMKAVREDAQPPSHGVNLSCDGAGRFE